METIAIFENWLRKIVGEQYLLVTEIFVIVFTALVLGWLTNKVIDALEEHAKKTINVWDDAFIEAFRRPIVWAVWILGVNLAAAIATRSSESPLYSVVLQINKVAVIFLVAMFVVNFITRAERNLVHPEYMTE
ncbi:MAG: mechanosensitive ion channel family protein, partial [bacterium]